MGMQMRCRHRYAVLCSICPVLDSTQLGKDHSQRIRNRSLSMLACTVIPAGRFAATVAKGAVVFEPRRRDWDADEMPASLCCFVQYLSGA